MSAATFSTSIEAQQAAALLEGYRFELGSHDARQWVSLWLESYRPAWIRDAVIEALYQGRYKSISVRQILELWSRRGQPIRHVTHEFESAVCKEFGEVKVATQIPQNRSLSSGASSIRKARRTDVASSSAYQMAGRDLTKKAGQAGAGPTAAVSFDLSATPPGMSPSTSAQQAPDAAVGSKSVDVESARSPHPAGERDYEPYRQVSRSAIQSPAETEALLRTQKQLNGVLYTSARAIPPFKPALPFSAQTLRLARQKALA